MKRATVAQTVALAAGVLLLLASWGCTKKLSKIIVANHRPTVRLTSAPIDTSGRYFYSITLNWVGDDPDGRVIHYLYSVDAPLKAPDPKKCPGVAVGDTCWESTTDNEKRLTFTASQPDPRSPNSRAIDPHVFVIKAVDNAGDAGPSVFRAFFSFTVAPTVRIESPTPSNLFIPVLSPSVRFSWSGNDVDGVFTIKPVRYKYRLFSSSDPFPLALASSNPDSLRRYYAPAFAESLGWRTTSAETTTAQFTNLTPGQTFLFAVVAFDEAGAYSPVFSRTSNLLLFQVGFAGNLGPKISFFNDFFNFTYKTGGYSTAPSAEVEVEIPEGVPVTVNWGAVPANQGSDMRSYRWALDIVDLADETPRSNEETDTAHWSTRSLLTTSATVGPFFLATGELATDHRVYLEAEDSNGLRSLGIVRFRVVKATFDRELLIVDDTRLRPDSRSTGTACLVGAPSGVWPTAAELDSFLFARGNVRWKCYEPMVSQPGLFAGYPFDTLGTRIGKTIMTVPLAQLVKYRHIVWIVDGLGGTFNRAGTDAREPLSALRYMTAANRVNTLSTYVRQGGVLWLLGSGVAFTSQESWNEPGNDENAHVFSSITGRSELGPGRFMYDVAKWQSEIRAGGTSPNPRIVRYTGRFQDSLARVGPSSPYAAIPSLIELKIASDLDDQRPPGRTATDFYSTVRYVELLQRPNDVNENIAPPSGVLAITISQVYAGGGDVGAVYNRDFVELRNRSSDVIDLTNWTLQYSTGGTSWQTVPLAGSVAAGRHYLVALAPGANGGALPTPDASGTINLSLSGGKIAIVKKATALTDSCPPANDEDILDVFGYGSGDCFETRRFGALNVANAAFRRSRGCEDTGFNDADFYAAEPSPRNSTQTGRICFEVPVLDTLYRVSAVNLPGPTVTPHLVGMTHYHGTTHNPVTFTGFDLWAYRRRQCVQLVDFVLGTLWGLQRAPSPPAIMAPRGASPDVGRQAIASPATPAGQRPVVTGRAGPTAVTPTRPAKPAGRTKSRWPWNN